ncbi:MAG: AAA family ATPase [Chloroflexota bacterium]|nr:AAA family ATPase [Chloroflexota bacterium]
MALTPPLSPGGHLPLVGRDHERAILADCFATTVRGQGRLVLVSGEAGIGKTALLTAFAAEAIAHSVRVAIGRCHDLTDTPPYGPWHELFRHAAQSADCPPLPAAFAHPDGIGPVVGQAILFAAVRQWLSLATEQRPIVLMLEDLHWGDPASLDLLRFLAPLASHLPLLLIVTFRSDELPPDHPLAQSLPILVREAHPLRLPLQRLTALEITTLIRAQYALSAASEERLVTLLAERAEGNPFFITELLHALEEERILTNDDSGWRLGDLAPLRVPLLARQVVERRLMRLDAEGRRLLTLAAVIGQEVPFVLWAAVAAVSEESLFTLAEQARAAHLIAETPDGSGIRFVHALTRQTLYEYVLVARQRQMHRAVAEALLAVSAPDVDAVAHHLKEAGDPRAPAWLTRAGLRAQRARAWQTAAERYTAALALLPATAATVRERGWLHFALGRMEAYDPLTANEHLKEAERLAAVGNDRALAAVVAYYRSLSRFYSDDVHGGITGMEAVVTALGILTEDERTVLWERQEWIGRALDEDDGAGQLAFFLAFAGRLAEARALAARIIDAASTSTGGHRGQGRSHADASLAAAIVAMHDGMPDAARRAARQAWQACDDLAAYDEAARALYIEALWINAAYPLEDADARARLLGNLLSAWRKTSVSLMPYSSDDLMRLPLAGIAGEWAMVRQIAAAFPLGSVTLEIIPRSVLAAIAYAQGETDLVERLVHEVLPEGAATAPGGTNFLTALVLHRLAARLAMDAADLIAARAWIAAHDRWLAWSGAVLGQAESALLWARYHRADGNNEQAEESARQALALATTPRQPLVLIAAHRLLGELETAGRDADADEHLEEALSLADACGAPYERALTPLARAERRAAMGDTATALTLLAEAQAICEPLGAQPALIHAEMLRARLTAARPQPVARFPDGLTEREVAVLRLLAGGQSNRAIGDTLGINARTAERHITNIYRKIGVDGRAEAAAYAVRHGLL